MKDSLEKKYDRYVNKTELSIGEHRTLNNKEKSDMKEWVQKNYNFGDIINPLWHPHLLYEIGLYLQNKHVDLKM